MKTKIAVAIMTLACVGPTAADVNVPIDSLPTQDQVGPDYHKQALLLHERLKKDGLSTSVAVIEKTLQVIDEELPKFFPDGPIEREDMIALAWLESGFCQHEGGTHGERGLFQIMPDEFAHWHVTKNFFNIRVNTRMALRVLQYKHKKWHDYKLTIQAYNGLVHLRNGKLSDKYWRAFVKRKIAVGELLGDK